MSLMAKLYYNLIEKGMWTIDNVPEQWREEVEQLLNNK